MELTGLFSFSRDMADVGMQGDDVASLFFLCNGRGELCEKIMFIFLLAIGWERRNPKWPSSV